MNDVQIFNNPDFGEVRTIIIDSEPWFVAKDISDILGYSKSANMLKIIDDDDKTVIPSDELNTGSNLEPQVYKQRYHISIINEPGVYSAAFGSKQPNAKGFKRWVTHEVLPSIRKTGMYSAKAQIPTTPSEQIKLLAQGHIELEKKVDDVVADVDGIKSDLETFKGELPCFPVELQRISDAAKKVGVTVMGGKKSKAYHDRSICIRVYRDIYSQLHREFDIKSFKAIQRKDVDTAIQIIEGYTLPLALKTSIEKANCT